MLANEFHLPFHINNVYEGFAQAKGIVHTSSDEIRLEFQISDALGGFLKSEPRNVIIPLSDLLELSFKSSVWSSKLTINVSSLGSIEDLPKPAKGKAGEVILRIKRSDKDKAKRLASRMNLLISEYRVRRSEEEDM